MKTFLRAFALLFCVASFAQTTVKGTVSDDSGMPLAGANIIVTGTSSGAMTDFHNKFQKITKHYP
jgi:iron complex outermembrane receptor protein